MTTTLYYFSGTGNSLVAARDLAKELGDTELVAISSAGTVPSSADAVGIVFPVYMWGLPLIVSRFMKSMQTKKDAYYFAVATCGGSAAGTLLQAEKIFAEKGAQLSAGFVVKMPGNYTPMYGAIKQKKQEKMFAAEKEKVKMIAAAVRSREVRPVERSNFVANRVMSGMFYSFSAPHIPEMDKSFWVNDKCNGCGICAKVCPVKNIALADGKPAWQHHCEQCLACLQWCPQEAIQSGKLTEGRKRYHHPDVAVKDFLQER